MDRIDTIEVPRTLPRPAATADIAAVLDAICSPRPRKDVPLGVLRDRVLFETAYVCGARASESAECTSKTWTCARTTSTRLHGKGGTVRTVLLDDRGYLALLRLYLARSSYTSGPQFRASVNGRGGLLSYDAAHNRWKKYCAAAGTGIGIHQLRHAHASELSTAACPSRWCARRRAGARRTLRARGPLVLAIRHEDSLSCPRHDAGPPGICLRCRHNQRLDACQTDR